MDEKAKMMRREFLRILPLLPPSLAAISTDVNDHFPLVSGRDEKETPKSTTRRGLTPLQALVHEIEPSKYDQDKFYNFFKRNYQGSEDFVPMVFESCDKYEKIHHVDKGLVMSQMLQESGFDPAAISWVGAVGLLQIMAPTAKDLGIKNVHYPSEYRKTMRRHEDAKRASERSNFYRNLSVGNARMNVRAFAKKRGKRIIDMTRKEIGEMESQFYRDWSGLGESSEMVDFTGEEVQDLLLESYGMFDESVKDLQEGIMKLFTRGDMKRIGEAYEDALYRFDHLLEELSVIQKYYEAIMEKRKDPAIAVKHLFQSALKGEESAEIMREVMEGYGKYTDEVRFGIFSDYRPGRGYRKGMFKLKPPSERLAFEGRSHERTNIDSGVKYDALLTRRLGGNVAYSMCAFNSGFNNVCRTVNSKTTGKEIKIFQIPFIRETVRYWDNIYKNFHE